MSGDNINKEEYKFPNREDKDKYSMSPVGGTESLKSLLKNKKLLRSMGIIVAFYLFLQVVTYFFNNKNDVAEAAVTNEPVMKVEEIKQPVPIESEVIERQPIRSQQIEKLSADVSDQELNISRFNSRLREIESLQQELAYKLTSLDKNYKSSMAYIMEYVNHQKQVEQAKRAAAMLQKINLQKQKKAKKFLVYYTRAAIDGRAWLVDKNSDQDITVKIGDKLNTYGVVTHIDADSGVIKTSSGREINLSPHDN